MDIPQVSDDSDSEVESDSESEMLREEEIDFDYIDKNDDDDEKAIVNDLRFIAELIEQNEIDIDGNGKKNFIKDQGKNIEGIDDDEDDDDDDDEDDDEEEEDDDDDDADNETSSSDDSFNDPEVDIIEKIGAELK